MSEQSETLNAWHARGFRHGQGHEQLEAELRRELHKPFYGNPAELTRSTRVRCLRSFYADGAAIAVGDVAYVQADIAHSLQALGKAEILD
jgi:hypothetical protein